MKKQEHGESQVKIQAEASPEIPEDEIDGQKVPPALAGYFESDPNHVRDIVREARRLRAVMGKLTPPDQASDSDKATANDAHGTNASTGTTLTEKAAMSGIIVENQTKPTNPDRAIPGKPRSPLDEEVRQFVYGKSACTSIDIMDFVRYLKDKGYSLHEHIILEKIYVTIEERKREARFAIEKEIEELIDETQAPEESDIRGLLRRLYEAGLVFEEGDVRRMIRGAVLRRA